MQTGIQGLGNKIQLEKKIASKVHTLGDNSKRQKNKGYWIKLRRI